jgi:hypothetical protein
MKKFLFTILTFITLHCSAQEWIEYKFDDNLTVDIPENSTIIDTLGQHLVRAVLDNAVIVIQRLPNTGETATNIKDKEELIKNYEGFQQGVVGSQHGKLINQKFHERQGLQVTEFSYSASMAEEQQLRYSLVVFLNENWYTVNFWEIESASAESKNDRDRLFSSIKFPAGQSLKNQLSNVKEGSRAYKLGAIIGRAVFFALIMGIIVAIIIVASRRKKKRDGQTQ